MKKLNVMLFMAVSMFAAVSCSDDDDDDNNPVVTPVITDADKNFVTNAADGGMFEIMAAQRALAVDSMMTDSMVTDTMMTDTSGMGTIGTGTGTGSRIAGIMLDSAGVRSFAQMMITDHTQANNELKTIASGKSITVPTTLSAAKQAKLDSLQSMTGDAFYQTYIKMMVASHKEAVNLFQTQSTSGNDSQLKDYATKWLPGLQTHLQHAQMMQDSLQ